MRKSMAAAFVLCAIIACDGAEPMGPVESRGTFSGYEIVSNRVHGRQQPRTNGDPVPGRQIRDERRLISADGHAHPRKPRCDHCDGIGTYSGPARMAR